MNKGGRPTKYKKEFPRQAVKLCKLAATDREIADFFEISEATLNRWKLEHSEFCEALKTGKEQADNRVHESLYRRAVGYEHDEIHISNYQGKITKTPIVKHYAPDPTSCIFWLKNRRPDEWRDIKAMEHSGTIGHYDSDDMTDEELQVIAARSRERVTRKKKPAKQPSTVH